MTSEWCWCGHHVSHRDHGHGLLWLFVGCASVASGIIVAMVARLLYVVAAWLL